MRIAFLAPLGVLAAGLGFAASYAAEPEPRPALGGRWVLNQEKSHDPVKKVQEAMTSGRGFGPGGGMGGPGGGRGPGGGMGGGRGPGGGMGPGAGRGRPEGGPDAGAVVLEPPLDGRPDAGEGGGRRRGPVASPRLTIDQDGDLVILKTEHNERLLQADGQGHDSQGPRGTVRLVVRWKKGALEAETKGERGGRRVERYRIDEDGRLGVEFDVEGAGPRPGYKFRLVYDREPAA